jgi:hypothetical protein
MGIVYDSTSGNLATPFEVNMKGSVLIGTDIISIESQAVWINLGQRQTISAQATLLSTDWTALFNLNSPSDFPGIDVFNHVTKQRQTAIQMEMVVSISTSFAPVVVIDDMLIVTKGRYQFRFNSTSGESSWTMLDATLQRLPSFVYISFRCLVVRYSHVRDHLTTRATQRGRSNRSWKVDQRHRFDTCNSIDVSSATRFYHARMLADNTTMATKR